MIIDLENTVFNFSEIVNMIEDTTSIFVRGNPRTFKDFGTVLVGTFSEEELTDLDGWVITPPAPVFSAPAKWRMPQLLKALGAFKSSSAASRNGWNKDIEEGFSQHLVRIKKVKGALTIFKKSDNI